MKVETGLVVLSFPFVSLADSTYGFQGGVSRKGTWSGLSLGKRSSGHSVCVQKHGEWGHARGHCFGECCHRTDPRPDDFVVGGGASPWKPMSVIPTEFALPATGH